MLFAANMSMSNSMSMNGLRSAAGGVGFEVDAGDFLSSTPNGSLTNTPGMQPTHHQQQQQSPFSTSSPLSFQQRFAEQPQFDRNGRSRNSLSKRFLNASGTPDQQADQSAINNAGAPPNTVWKPAQLKQRQPSNLFSPGQRRRECL